MTQLPPEGISQSAWDEAREALIDAGRNPEYELLTMPLIARAIMAATERERERCALIADYGVKWTPEPDKKALFLVNESCSRIAAAIRQGSQPLNAIPLKGVVR